MNASICSSTLQKSLWRRLREIFLRALFLLVPAIFLLIMQGCAGDVATRVASFAEQSPPGDLDFSPDGKFLAVDPWGNGNTDIWDLARKRLAFHVVGGTGGMNGESLIRYSPDGSTFAVCSSTIDVYDASSGKALRS